jgi:hypothetical protein
MLGKEVMPMIPSIPGEYVDVAGCRVPVTHLGDLFRSFYEAGWTPADEGLEEALLDAVRRGGTSISVGEEDAWSDALGEAYLEFCDGLSVCMLDRVEDL